MKKDKSVYDLKCKVITLNNISKRSFEGRINQLVSEEQLRNEITAALKAGGRVYACYSKKDCVGCYIFVKESVREKTESDGKNKEEFVYRLNAEYINPEAENLIKFMKKSAETGIIDTAAMENCEYIIWNDEKLTRKKEGSPVLGWIFGMNFGIMYGTILKNVALGIIFGFSMGAMFSQAFITTKIIRTKIGDNEN